MSKPELKVCLSPVLLNRDELEDKSVVVIDILRATSTICTALANGAKAVIPVKNMEAGKDYIGDEYILAAERQGQKVEGYEFGNSPFEYSKEKISGKTIVLTTTNGTRAIELSAGAAAIVAGSFLNISAVCNWLREEQRSAIFFCAGWKDSVNMEDTLFAGAVVQELKNEFSISGDSALAASYLYDYVKDEMIVHMRKASHYQRLHQLGIDRDLEYCFEKDLFDIVPILKDGKLIIEQ